MRDVAAAGTRSEPKILGDFWFATRWFATRWFATRWFATRWFATRWFATRQNSPRILRTPASGSRRARGGGGRLGGQPSLGPSTGAKVSPSAGSTSTS
ncbi:hypothetical protein GCM10022225_78440 [Plantactinospora mayteni]